MEFPAIPVQISKQHSWRALAGATSIETAGVMICSVDGSGLNNRPRAKRFLETGGLATSLLFRPAAEGDKSSNQPE
jgi:hypothetical protein